MGWHCPCHSETGPPGHITYAHSTVPPTCPTPHCTPHPHHPHPSAAHSPHVAPSRLGALPCGYRNMGRISPLRGQLIEFGFGAISSRRVDPPALVPGTGLTKLSTQSPAVLLAWHLPLRPTQDPRCTRAHKKPSRGVTSQTPPPRPCSARFRCRLRACVRHLRRGARPPRACERHLRRGASPPRACVRHLQERSQPPGQPLNPVHLDP